MFALGSAWLWLLHELQRRTESLLGRQQTAQCLPKCQCTCLTAAKTFKPRPKSMVGSTFKRQRHHPREPRPDGPTCRLRRTRPRRGNPACSTGSRSPSATAARQLPVLRRRNALRVLTACNDTTADCPAPTFASLLNTCTRRWPSLARLSNAQQTPLTIHGAR